MEGPIARYSDVADTLYTGKPLEYRNVVDGYVRIFWGLFKKMVIADRMALMVNQVFDHYADYHGAVILAAAIGYVIQLYMESVSYTHLDVYKRQDMDMVHQQMHFRN